MSRSSISPERWVRTISGSRLAPAASVMAWLLCVACDPLRPYSEPLAYMLLLAWICLNSKIQKLFRSLPRLQRTFCAVATGALVAAQLFDEPRKTYPLVSWTMYSNATLSSNRVNSMQARLVDGRIVAMPLFPFPSILNAPSKLRSLVDSASSSSLKVRTKAQARLPDFEACIRNAYEKNHPGQKIRSLILLEGRFELKYRKERPLLVWTTYYESPPME